MYQALGFWLRSIRSEGLRVVGLGFRGFRGSGFRV